MCDETDQDIILCIIVNIVLSISRICLTQAICEGSKDENRACNQHPCVCALDVTTYFLLNGDGSNAETDMVWIEKDGKEGPTSEEEYVYPGDEVQPYHILYGKCNNW